jgi:hypothetical protein
MPTFPGFEHIYGLHDPCSNRPLRGDFAPDVDCLALTRGEVNPPETVRVGWAMGGRKPSDFIWTTSAHPVIVHRRVADLLRENGITGWRSYRASVTDKDGEFHENYEGLAISGRCGSVNLSRSVVTLKEYPGGWYPQFLGHYFAEESWDGSDVFMERPDSTGKVTARIFVSEKVLQVFNKAEIKNVLLERLTETMVSTSVYAIGGSHLLPANFAQLVSAAYRRAGVPRPA